MGHTRSRGTTISQHQNVILGLVGIGALFIVASPARSADFTPPPPVAASTGTFQAFVSGGAFWTGGDPIPYGGTSDLLELGEFVDFDPAVAPNVGWNTGAGFDYRFAASPWHINGQARYGQSKGSSSAAPLKFSELGTDENGNPEGELGSANTSATLTETHWLIDFGAGYDVPFGRSSLQLNFGIRTAYLTADTTSPSNIGLLFGDPMATPPDPTSVTASLSSIIVQKSTFLGAGPRFGVEGSVPFGNFSFDYAADAAWLIGSTRINSEIDH